MFKIFNRDVRRQKREEYKKAVYREWGTFSAQGKGRYVLKKATYGWALQVFVIYCALMYTFAFFSDYIIFDLYSVVVALVVFVVFGAVQGSMEFDRNERIYREKYPYKPAKKSKK